MDRVAATIHEFKAGSVLSGLLLAYEPLGFSDTERYLAPPMFCPQRGLFDLTPRVALGSCSYLCFCLFLGLHPRAAGASTELREHKGDVSVRLPQEKGYAPASSGAVLPEGTRLRTGQDGEATIRFEGGEESKVRPRSEIIVRASSSSEGRTSGIVLFFGRVWSKIAKSAGAGNTFEVRSANAVAGVRGTEFEVGVADDGSTRVIVGDGVVAVEGDDAASPVEVARGWEIEGSSAGHLDGRKKAEQKPDWDGWFSARAKQLEKQGIRVARDLEGRLNRRREKVEALLKEQRGLRKAIEALEVKKETGSKVDGELKEKLSALERVTSRLEDMKARLHGAFGLFARWGALARKGGMDGAEDLGKMSDNIAKVAADFADMIEEGTDQSEEGMDDMLDDMKKGKKDRPTKNAGDELF